MIPAGDRDDRSGVIAHLHHALVALERNDEASWRAHMDALLAWRTQPLVQGLARLARELEQALGETAASGSSGSLPEACARLEHVVALTEAASLRTLDLIEECAAEVRRADDADPQRRAEALAGIRTRLSAMTEAQSYQDLTGQIIRRVVGIVREVHAGLHRYVGAAEPPLRLGCTRGEGPAIRGLDPEPATQDDANRLLSELGL